MRFFRALITLFALTITLSAQSTPQRGIELGDLDRKVSPCNDFFEFSNGSWRAQNPIPASQTRWSRRWAAGESTKDQLKEILDQSASKHDSPPGSTDQLIGDFYGACMDEARINQQGIKPLQPLLASIDAIKDKADVEKMIARFHQIGVPVPFVLYANSDNHNPTDVVANLAASGLGLPDRDYYSKPEPRFQEAREKYRAHMIKIFELAGYSPAQAKSASAAAYEFESKLADASLDNVALRDPRATDHKMTFAELKKLAPDFNWTAYTTALAVPHADLNVTEPRFIQEFDRQLTQNSIADWKSYLKWQLLNAAAPDLSSDFVNEDFAFNDAYLNGAKEMKPRWKRCTESTDSLLGEALGKKYTDQYFPPAAKARMQDLVKNLRLALADTIQELDWMSPATKQKALEKLSTFNPKIGYPDKWKDYSHVKISRDSYWDDVIAGNEFRVNDNLAQIGKPVDRGRWGMTPPTSNAYYNPLLNEIVFPAGILQPPAFSLDNTDAVNYGAIGVVIGHEISHGFDDQGSQFDAQGRLNNWWTPEDLSKFRAKTGCVVDQFDNYFVEPGIHENGKLVLGESIGDLAGLKIAYRAFHLAQKTNPAKTIDGFTPDQQFFIAWGQFRGDETRPEQARTMVQGDPHPIGKFRVIGPVSNFPPFAEAFSCKEGSPMVRPAEKRCEPW